MALVEPTLTGGDEVELREFILIVAIMKPMNAIAATQRHP